MFIHNLEETQAKTAQAIRRAIIMGACELTRDTDFRNNERQVAQPRQNNRYKGVNSGELTKIKRSEFIKMSRTPQDTFFSAKELFMTAHTRNGMNFCFERLSIKDQSIIKDCNIGLSDGMRFTMENEMPQLSAYNGATDFVMAPYHRRNRHSGQGEAVHFFIRDRLFADAIWKNLDRSTFNLRKFDVLFAPDYSLYVDAPSKMITLWNTYRSRFVALFWQLNGYDVIPTASWGNAESLKFCFEGLPNKSVIAVCGIGHSFCRSAKTLWNYAVDKLIEEKQPSTLIVYGGDRREAESHGINVKYFEDVIRTNFRN